MKGVFRILFTGILLVCASGCAVRTASPADAAALDQKAREKAQQKLIKQEIRHFKELRDEAVMEFAKTHQPSSIMTPPMIGNDLKVTNVICVGDNMTGMVMLLMDVTPMFGDFRLYMGGERNGTDAHAQGNTYPSADLYGRVYSLHSGIPEQICVRFYNISTRVSRLDWVDISMGLSLMTLNFITLREIPIYWTYSDNAIAGMVKAEAAK